MTKQLFSGQQVDQYTLQEQIGEGGMGVVYAAWQPAMTRKVAIKFLSEVDIHPDAVKRFEREVTMISLLEHPHILPVYAFGSIDNIPYIVMRHMNGGTLASKFKGRSLKLSQLLRALEQIADALDYAHEQGVVHRDIKPANVFFDDRDNAYLADFGLAKTTSGSHDLTRTDEGVSGTPDYMSPEQVRGMKVDGRSDIYSLAIISYQAITGEPPFMGKNAMDIVLKHLSSPVPSLAEKSVGMPVAADVVFQKALAKDSVQRYEKARDFVTALDEAMLEHSPQTLSKMVPLPRNLTGHTGAAAVGRVGPTTEEHMQIPYDQKTDPDIYDGQGILEQGQEQEGEDSEGGWLVPTLTVSALLLFSIVLGLVFWFNLDPLSNLPVDSFDVGPQPRAAVYDGDSGVWVSSIGQSDVGQYNASCMNADAGNCGQALNTHDVRSNPHALTVYDGKVWVAHLLSNEIVAIDIDTQQTTAVVLDRPANNLLWIDDILWVSVGDQVVRLDASGNELGRVTAGELTSQMATDGENVWVASDLGDAEGAIFKISIDEPITAEKWLDLPINSGIVNMVAANNYLWVTLSRSNLLLQVDLDSGDIVRETAVGENPLAMIEAAGYIWIANLDDNTVVAFQVADGLRFGQIEISGGPTALAYAPCGENCGDLWVVSEATSRLQRVHLENLFE